MSEVKNIPRLRFPGFDDHWRTERLGKISKFQNGVGHEQSIDPEGNIIVVNSKFISTEGEVKKYTQEVLSEIPDDSFSMVMSDVPNGKAIAKCYYFIEGGNYSLNQRICSIKSKTENNKFLFYQINRNKYYLKFDNGVGQTNLRKSEVLNCPVILPSIPEQKKIADFLTAVDKRIELLEKKKTLLETYKKGVMKKIFDQEIRFKDNNGNDFPDWEEYILNELGNTLNGLTGKTKDDFDSGSSKYIQYKQVFGDSKIDPKGFGLVDVGGNEKQTEIKYGDILFTTSSETPNEIGMSSVYMSEIENVYLNSFCFGFRPKSLKNVVPNFSRFLFRSDKVRSSIVKLAQGSTRYNMSKTNFLKIRVKIPLNEEQVKISEFLSSIDNQIELLKTQIDKSKTWKKGLLQKMFV